jgi:carbon starvation protein
LGDLVACGLAADLHHHRWLIKLFDANPAIGFLSLAKKYSDALANGQILAPAKDITQMQHVIFNAYTNATLTALFLFVVFSILFYALKVGIAAWGKRAYG